jgi:hypothetical protein
VARQYAARRLTRATHSAAGASLAPVDVCRETIAAYARAGAHRDATARLHACKAAWRNARIAGLREFRYRKATVTEFRPNVHWQYVRIYENESGSFRLSCREIDVDAYSVYHF